MKKIYSSLIFCLLASMAIALSSCDPDDPALSGLVGPTWQLEEDQAGQVYDSEIVRFQFYGDGTGTYGFYNDYGQWDNMDFSWYSNVSGVNRVQINHANGQTSYYYYHFSGSDLIISTSPDFYPTWERYIMTYD